jgi:hypothetical protein
VLLLCDISLYPVVEHVFREGNRHTDLLQEKFAVKSPDTSVPHRNAVRRLIEKFRETGSVLEVERSGRPSKLNDEKLLDISDSVLRSPSKSLRKLPQEEDIGLAQSSPKTTETLERTVNSERHCSVLYDFIGLLEQDEITYSWFQQDGATAHTANNSMKLLNEISGERVFSANLWPLARRTLLHRSSKTCSVS